MKILFKHTFLAIFMILSSASIFAQVDLTTLKVEIPTNQKEITTIASNFLTGLIEGKFEDVNSLLSKDFQGFGFGAKPMNGAELIKLWESYHAGNSAMSISEGGVFAIKIKEGSEKGTSALIYGNASWTPKELGKPVGSWVHMMVKVKEEKIYMIYNFQDELGPLMQMGFQVLPPSSDSGRK